MSILTTLVSCQSKPFKEQDGQHISRGLSSNSNFEAIDTRYVLWKSNKVYYNLSGSSAGIPILFIHGWACDSSFWNSQISYFSKSHRVISIDLPGHGRSDKPKDLRYSIDDFVDATMAVINKNKIENLILVGHSLGGAVVRQLYRRFPKIASGLVFVDSDIGPWPAESVESSIKSAHDLAGENYHDVATEIITQMFVDSTSDEYKNKITSMMLRTPQWVMSRALQGLAQQEIYRKDSIAVPTLTVMANNQYLDPNYKENLRSFIIHLTYSEIDKVGHFLMIEKPMEFNQLLDNFLLKSKDNLHN